MKLQLDTTAKTVKIENEIKISLLIKTLKALLPKDWKDFTLQTNVTINNWTNSIYIESPKIIPTSPGTWYYYDSGTTELKTGTYNVEVTI